MGYRALSNWIFGLAVFVFAAITGAQTLLGKEQMRLVPASSRVAPVPQVKIFDRPYFASLADWSADNFWTRGPLITFGAIAQYYGFNSASDERVLPGKDGWIFFGDEKYRRNVAREPFLNEEFRSTARDILSQRRDWLAERGIAFAFVVGPNKSNVYQEMLPWRAQKGDGPSEHELFLRELAAEGLPIVDSFEALRQAKLVTDEPLYFKQDSHWSNLGAAYAVEETVNNLNNFHPDLKIPELRWKENAVRRSPGSFGKLMGIPFDVYGVDTVKADGATPSRVDADEICNLLNEGKVRTCWRVQSAGRPYKAMLIGDSFGDFYRRSLFLAFGDVLVINAWNIGSEPQAHFPTDIIEAYQPDIVINVMAEYRFEPCMSGETGSCSTRIGIPNPFEGGGTKELNMSALWQGVPDGEIIEDLGPGTLSATGYRAAVRIPGEFDQDAILIVKYELSELFDGEIVGLHRGEPIDGVDRSAYNRVLNGMQDQTSGLILVSPEPNRDVRYVRLVSEFPLSGVLKIEWKQIGRKSLTQKTPRVVEEETE